MVGSRVYVGGLPYGVRERDLERFFKGYGRTRDILLKNGYGFVVSVTYFYKIDFRLLSVYHICIMICFVDCADVLSSLMYNFQEFEDYRDADDAVYELNGKELLGERYLT